MRKCQYCGSEFVVWNWLGCFGFWSGWKRNFWYNGKFPYFRWRFWQFFDRWGHTCWNCGDGGELQFTFFKVRNGMPYDVMTKTFVHLPVHNIPEIRNQLYYMTSPHACMRKDDKKIWDERKQQIIDLVNETLEEQWKLDHPEVTNDNS